MYKRQGIYYDESPVDSNYLNPETPSMTKISYSLGMSFRLAACAALDVAYCYVSSADPERTGSYPDKGTFHTQLALPTTVTWGVSYRPNDKWRMGVDLQWIGWSAYKDLNVSFNEKELGIKDIYSVKNYSNTLSARFGAEYDALDWLAARVGIYYDAVSYTHLTLPTILLV